ncbi:PP2C family protein-serine/threonine phosphatase [Pelosinus fermentans]|uniref:Protein phosphatase 2C domain protein n=2 Tax=Pelosinus TaxID=365348 RepID=I9LF94_9FIRM|nr:protein phosphatase 2C domain-containing protein [Pelosinus fermentans]EIW19159.1 protein phosphatase 2C domain protein [Pelosinus fermentans B4]EIW25109.1 protein serine/threonine phosphatase [Pelosinus fermentans A11]OAM96140.1 protein serine/threonine phosphatase [Pelosinus fermentans DSM 17108]SDR36784.1 Serine/threonine protein phosphatase PrpC [Pelosinus fermentans]
MIHAPAALILVLSIAVIALVIKRMTLTPAYNTRVGQCMTIGDREVQEDDYGVLANQTGTLLVLADGMGRKYGGKIAGRVAVETFVDLFKEYKAFEKPQYYFRKAFHAANRAILNKVEDGRGSASVAAALIADHTLYYALVGNIKIAVYHGGDLVPVSEGHTISVLAQQKYLQGRLAKKSAIELLDRHRLYNFVGQDGFKDIEFFSQPLPLRAGDAVVLISDGIYETLLWREIEHELAQGRDAQQQALRIIERVNRSKLPNKDNASIVIYRC